MQKKGLNFNYKMFFYLLLDFSDIYQNISQVLSRKTFKALKN
jgi:hypothetical protein